MKQVLLTTKIEPRARRIMSTIQCDIYMFLLRYCYDITFEYAVVSETKLARLLNVSKSIIVKSLRLLRKRGFITVSKMKIKGRWMNIYQFPDVHVIKKVLTNKSNTSFQLLMLQLIDGGLSNDKNSSK